MSLRTNLEQVYPGSSQLTLNLNPWHLVWRFKCCDCLAIPNSFFFFRWRFIARLYQWLVDQDYKDNLRFLWTLNYTLPMHGLHLQFHTLYSPIIKSRITCFISVKGYSSPLSSVDANNVETMQLSFLFHSKWTSVSALDTFFRCIFAQEAPQPSQIFNKEP